VTESRVPAMPMIQLKAVRHPIVNAAPSGKGGRRQISAMGGSLQNCPPPVSSL
jgi:hypothetical protein